MEDRYAILMDGGFVTKALSSKLKAFPSHTDIVAECGRIISLPELAKHSLLRIYYYDAPPATGVLTNPIDGTKIDLSSSVVHTRSTQLIEKLEMERNFAVRKGEAVTRGWELGKRATQSMLKHPRVPSAHDLVPNIQQKGVDLRIGLDIALLSLRHLAQIIVVVTGDSDLVPAFKFARREGVRVFLDYLGMPVRRELKVHADHIV